MVRRAEEKIGDLRVLSEWPGDGGENGDVRTRRNGYSRMMNFRAMEERMDIQELGDPKKKYRRFKSAE